MSEKNLKIDFLKQAPADDGTIAVVIPQRGAWPAPATALDKQSGGQLKRAAATAHFACKTGEVCEVLAPHGISASRVLLVGRGDPSLTDASTFEHIGGAVLAHLSQSGEQTASIEVTGLESRRIAAPEVAQRVAFGARLRAYRFDRYKTSRSAHEKPALAAFNVVTPAAREAQKGFARFEALAQGMFLTRDLISEPANALYPKEFAARVAELTSLGVKVEILGQSELEELGFGALLGVAQGSVYEPQVVLCEYNGARAKKGSVPVVLAGKGVTFDAGGVNIKPSAGLETLKMDMGGAASVVGAIKTLALRNARCHVVGICALVENMVSGSAQRPGDVVKSLSGKTIEVINTDAEGRLVLADILWYAQERYRPKWVVDMATLTGAIVIALGQEYAGLFCNDEQLAKQLITAGARTGDRLWQYPMGPAYDRHLESMIADVKNLGPNEGRSIIAAQFIQRFIQSGVRWAHVDFGGMVWTDEGTPVSPKGATGFGVRLLDDWIAAHHES